MSISKDKAKLFSNIAVDTLIEMIYRMKEGEKELVRKITTEEVPLGFTPEGWKFLRRNSFEGSFINLACKQDQVERIIWEILQDDAPQYFKAVEMTALIDQEKLDLIDSTIFKTFGDGDVK